MNTCSFTIHFKRTSVCSKVFVECIIYYVELEEMSTSVQSVPLTLEGINWRELALRVPITSTLWTPKALDLSGIKFIL